MQPEGIEGQFYPLQVYFLRICGHHGLRTFREEIAFTARPKIHSHSKIFRYGLSIFRPAHHPIFQIHIFDSYLHLVSVISACPKGNVQHLGSCCSRIPLPLHTQRGNEGHHWQLFPNKASKLNRNVVSEYPLVAQRISNGCGIWIKCARIPRAKPTALRFLLQ